MRPTFVMSQEDFLQTHYQPVDVEGQAIDHNADIRHLGGNEFRVVLGQTSRNDLSAG